FLAHGHQSRPREKNRRLRYPAPGDDKLSAWIRLAVRIVTGNVVNLEVAGLVAGKRADAEDVSSWVKRLEQRGSRTVQCIGNPIRHYHPLRADRERPDAGVADKRNSILRME